MTALARSNSEHSVILSSPGAAEAKALSAMFDDAQSGMRRVVALGLFAHEIKARLKHGQFGLWLAEHAPKLSKEVDGRWLASSQLTAYMGLASGVLESCEVKLKEYLGLAADLAKIRSSDLCHGGEILLLPEGRVPEEAREFRDKICELVDGKTQRQLFAEFKTADDDGAVAKAGGAKSIRFHCPKCPSIVLLGKFGTMVLCPKCGVKQKAKPDPLSAAQELAAQREHWQDLLSGWRNPLRSFLDAAEEGDELARKDWQEALDDLLQATALARTRLKKSPPRHKATKGGGK